MSDAQSSERTEHLSVPPGSSPSPPEVIADTLARPEDFSLLGQTAAVDSTPLRAVSTPSALGETLAIHSSSALLTEPSLPKNVAGYDILEVLGRGGMGVVYKAKQRGLNRMAAIKMILAAGHASSTDFLRFQIEAEAVAKLQHPNIVQIYEVGENDGHPFFSLEYVDGGTLAGKLQNPLPARQAAELVEPLARAMQYAHENNLLHRDIKPGNILLTLNGTPKITDFGLAKRIGEESSHNTGTGSILGTPSYMAPEQAEGKIRELGPGVDIYALGSVLYHALTGRPPFMGETVLDTLHQVKNDDPVPPSRLQPRVPRDLEIICLKCLQKEPRKRYLSAQDLADDLKRFLNSEPIRARPVSLTERAIKWARRRPQVASLLACLLFAIVGGFLGMLMLWLRAEGLRADAEQARGEAEHQATIAEDRTIVAKKAQRAAVESYEGSLRTLYAAQMNLAQDAINEAKVGRLRDLLQTQPDKLRGFEWSYLKGLLRSETLGLQGHMRQVQAVAFRPPEGKELATASGDGSIIVWEPNAGQGPKFRFLKGHQGAVRRIGFSRTGGHLASGAEDGSIQVWDLASSDASPTRVLTGHRHGVNAIAFGPEAHWLVSASDDGTLKIWNLLSETDPVSLKGHDYAVTDVAVSSDGDRIVSASLDRTVRVWGTRTQQEELICLHEHWVTAVAFSADGKKFASAGWDKALKVWNAQGGALRVDLEGLPGPVQSLAFSPDGSRLAASCLDHSVLVWDLETRKILRNWPGEPGKVRTVAFSADGQLLASVNFDLSKQEGRALKASAPLLGLAFGIDRSTLATIGSDGNLAIWNADAGTRRQELSWQRGALRAIAFDSKRQTWAVASEEGDIGVIKPDGDSRAMLKGHNRWVQSLAFDGQGSQLASGAADGIVKLWDPAQGICRRTLKAHSDAVRCVAFSPDSKWLASAGADRLVRLWDSATGEPRESVFSHEGPVLALAFHPTEPLLASASADRTIKLWNLDTGLPVHTLRGHAHAVTGLAFSPDGRRLVSGSEDQTLKIWDPGTGQETLTLRGHTQGVTGVAFSSDGRCLASSSWDQTLRLWEAGE